jgi:hypothetical protein
MSSCLKKSCWAPIYGHEQEIAINAIHELVREQAVWAWQKRQPGRNADRQVGEVAGVKLQRLPDPCQAGAYPGLPRG